MSRLLTLIEADTLGPVLALVDGIRAEQQAASLINAFLINEQHLLEPRC